MSQAGIVDIEGTHPQIPTLFVCNVGSAVPLANVLEVLGTIVAAHSVPLETIGSGNTVTIETQYASAAVSSVGTNAGMASFSSTQFSVDANGYVTLNGSAVAETITGNTGGALSPVAGNWNILGTSTAPGTTPVQTSGSGNTLTVQVQKSQAIASTNATNVGLAAFNSTQFTVDANGFVSLTGTGAGETITGNSGGALSPTAGNWNIVGTGSITTSGSVSTLTIQLTGLTNHAVLVGAGTATITNVGPSASAGTVLASNGLSADPSFQSIASLGGITTITGNTGGPESPLAGNFNILGTGSITVVGSANTETVQLTGLTNHAIQVGAGTATLTQVGPTATAGQVLQSQGSSADPAFSTATYPSTTTINQILYSSANNVVSQITAVNSASLVTSSTGVPSLAAMTSGQLIIGNTGGTPTAALPTSIGGNFIAGAGSLKYIPANYQKGFANIGFSYSAGTFTVLAADGTSLSATNPAYVVVPSPTAAGQYLTIAVTANQTFTDGSGGTLAGMKFGLPYGGTDVSWAVNMPMFLYAVPKSDGTAIAFMISRNPNATKSPAAAGIGQSGSVVNVSQTDMFSLTAITAANYASQPCVYIGCFQVQYTAGTPSFYTVQALTAGIDGPGLNYNTQLFSMPTGANGAASGKYFMDNGGTAPSWTSQQYGYYPQSNGMIRVQFSGATSLAVAGVGAVNARFILPYNVPSLNNPMISGLSIIGSPGGGYILLTGIVDGTSQIYAEMAQQTGNAKTLNSAFSVTNANICSANITYLTTT